MPVKKYSILGEELQVGSSSDVNKLLDKVNNPKKVTVDKRINNKKLNIEDKMLLIKENVYKILGKYKDNTEVITDYSRLKEYFDKAISNGIIAVDTETNNTLDTINCKLMGLCIYTPGEKQAYVPVNHVDLITKDLLTNQLTTSQIEEQLLRLNNTKIIFHNAKFDIKVLYTTCHVKLTCYWDTLLGAKLLNENESAKLKDQYSMHVDTEQEKYSIEHLFEGYEYAIFEPDLFALYAATDSYITYKLYEHQLKEFAKPENKNVYNLLLTLEIPLIKVLVDMELRGTSIDEEYTKRLSKPYHEKSEELQTVIDNEVLKIKPAIIAWRASEDARTLIGKKTKSQQLEDPINFDSSTQLAIILYDILKVGVIDKKHPRCTDKNVLGELAETIPLCKAIVEKRKFDILIDDFIDKLPTLINSKSGKIHGSFNQLGTATGRFSSSDPNLQQIPSHDKTIRMMFKPTTGYSIVGADYSGQELRILASASQDKKMIETYAENKDLYAMIGSYVFHNNYEDNLEFHPVTGKLQPEGKERRSKSKSLLLGLNYGMGLQSLADRVGETKEKAKAIIDNFYSGFVGVDKYTKQCQQQASKYGFVEDLWGRRRLLDDAKLPEYNIYLENQNQVDFNPLFDVVEHKDNRVEALIAKYKKAVSNIKWNKDYNIIKDQALKEGVIIQSNSIRISKAQRQTLNAVIQGSAASMMKSAMIKVYNDEELNKLGFKLLVTVHDEMFGEVPTENAQRAGERLCEVMIEAAKERCNNVAWKCDPYIVSDGWYEDENVGNIRNTFAKLARNLSEQEALEQLYKSYPMFNQESIKASALGQYTISKDSLKYGLNYYN